MTKAEEKAKEYFIKTFNSTNNIIDEQLAIEEAYKDGYNESKAEILFLQTTINNMKADRETLFQEFTDTLIKNDGLVLKTEYDKLKAQRDRLIEILNKIDNAQHADLEDYGYNVMEILNDEGHGFWNNW